MSKIFSEEIRKLFQRLTSGQKFAFSKYADGEWAVINKKHVTSQGEFTFNPDHDSYYSKKLLESYQYKDDGYYIGISCPCCQGMETHKKMLHLSGQDDEHITYANIFVNNNYKFYVENFVPFYGTQKTVLIANRRSKFENLSFTPEKIHKIDNDAFKSNFDLVEKLKKECVDKENYVYLFAAGPLGNLLAAELWKTNKKNVYLDIGSTLNPWLQAEGHKRDYYMGRSLGQQDCVWGC